MKAVRGRAGRTGPAVFVRINHPETGLAQADVEAALGAGLDGLRIPKVESADTVHLIETWTEGSVPLACNIESAAGVLSAREIASSSPRVLTIAFGAADFLRDAGSGALRLPSGDFVDVAIVRRAEATLRLAQALADRRSPG